MITLGSPPGDLGDPAFLFSFLNCVFTEVLQLGCAIFNILAICVGMFLHFYIFKKF